MRNGNPYPSGWHRKRLELAPMEPCVRAAAEDWATDCEWADVDGREIRSLSDAALRRGISQHYDGGWPGFLADCV